jgi:hypothetical protein
MERQKITKNKVKWIKENYKKNTHVHTHTHTHTETYCTDLFKLFSHFFHSSYNNFVTKCSEIPPHFPTELVNKTPTYTHKTDKFFIANCLVWLIDRGWALWSPSIAETSISTTVVITALVSKLQLTCCGAAWTLQ